ncbi:MAG: hydrolase [Nitrosopumilaceae archaeon]|uniref:Hydrolase n=1 Tax=Candidatus Nitrosomaritimum aestuariumsis TaxID=3342354 RepID=A0AC60W4P6_9ARCH|nr:hydrolase [Nitrosopumilaceae archaeon]
MSENSKDELIEAQKQVIGILFEVIKRLQANNDLDEEYFQIISDDKKTKQSQERLESILNERAENAKIVGRLLAKLED